jgi:hypothetical protein
LISSACPRGRQKAKVANPKSQTVSTLAASGMHAIPEAQAEPEVRTAGVGAITFSRVDREALDQRT